MITTPLKKIKIKTLIVTLLFFGSCKECPTEPKDPELYLSAPYVETSIVWLKVTSPDSTLHKSFVIQRDTVTILEAAFMGGDTIIADRTVQPNTSYTYTVNYVKNGRIQDQSASVNVTTLDISSSYFTWEVLYFGEPVKDNLLKNVSIADENDIWVVGSMEVWGWDSLYSEYGWVPYNALHWDGETWKMVCINPPPWNYRGQLDAVFAVSDSIVWAPAAAPSMYRNGTWYACENAPVPNWMLDIWGNSLFNTFFTYYGGGIAHYNGTSFQIMQSGTDVDLRDIDGNDERVYTLGCTGGSENIILEYEYTKDEWKTLLTSHTVNGNFETGDMGQFYSVKVLDDVVVFTCAAMATLKYYYQDGLYDAVPQKITILDDCWRVEIIDGNAINDLGFITIAGEIVHYNGREFQKCYDYELIHSHDISILDGDYKDNIICAVGEAQGQGVVIIGKK